MAFRYVANSSASSARCHLSPPEFGPEQQLPLIQRGQLSAVQQYLTIYPHMAHVFPPRGVDEVGNRIITGRKFKAGKIQDHDSAPSRHQRNGERAQPSARAPLSVAICSACHAGSMLAPPLWPLASSAVKRISSNISSRLLLAAPSVPMPTLMPAFSSETMGAASQAIAQFQIGRRTMRHGAALLCQQFDFPVIQVDHVHRNEIGTAARPSLCKRSIGRTP